MTDINAERMTDHEQARRSPDHVIAALGDIFATVETAAHGSPYVRLYLMPYSNTIDGRWIAVDLHDDDAARIIAELGKALSDVLFDRAVGGGTCHELSSKEDTCMTQLAEPGERRCPDCRPRDGHAADAR